MRLDPDWKEAMEVAVRCFGDVLALIRAAADAERAGDGQRCRRYLRRAEACRGVVIVPAGVLG